MRRDPGSTSGGFQNIFKGMNSGLAPNLIGADAAAFSRNVTFRDGRPQTRPGWRKRPITFDNVDAQTAFEDGLFQGATCFDPMQGGHKLVASIAGRLWSIDTDTFSCSELTMTDRNSAVLPKAWFEQAEDFLIVQDNQSAPLIYDGSNLRRVDPNSIPNEVPVGNVMVYSNGRLWVALPQGRSFVGGNLIYGEDGTAQFGGRDSVLRFTENNFLNGGGEFAVPNNAGRIRAMRPIANLDTSLGQGPLQVFTERGAFSVNAPFDRTQWQNLTYPIETVSLLGSGAESQEATTLVNGDIWFRSSDGIRSFQIARRDQGGWVNTPMSTEMFSVIRYDDKTLLNHSSAVLFDNRYLVTASPFRVRDHGICWRGVIALDFHNASGISVRSAPVYDGLWTGLNILQLVRCGNACFMFVLDCNENIELWELTTNDPFDNGTTRIACFMDTSSFGFQDGGWDRKELSTGRLFIGDAIGQVTFDIGFRPDQYPCYLPWHSWSIDSKRESCLTECSTPDSLQPQYRTSMRLPLPNESCNARVSSPLRQGFEFQCRLAWLGHVRLERLMLIAHELQEDSLPACEPTEETDIDGISCCDTSLWSYSSGCMAPAVFANTEQTFTAECPEGEIGEPVTVTIPAGAFSSETSQAAADALALAAATSQAQAALECVDAPFANTEGLFWWPFGEASGNRVDVVNGVELVPTNEIHMVQADAKVAKGLSFVPNINATVIIQSAHTEALAYAGGGFDCMFWLKINAYGASSQVLAPNLRFYDAGDVLLSSFFFDAFNASIAKVSINSGGDSDELPSPLIPAAGDWHCFRVFYDGSDNQIGIQVDNGAVVKSGYSLTTPMPAAAKGQCGVWHLGSGGGGSQDNFLVDEFVLRINGLFTVDEVTSYFASGAGRTYP
jgi:hypothetical protein